MLGVGRGPLLVGVADRPAAVVHCARACARGTRLRPGRSACRSVRAAEPGRVRARRARSWKHRDARHRHHPHHRAGRAIRRPATTTAWRASWRALAIASWADIENDATIVADVAALVRRAARRAADRLASRLRAHAAARDAARHRRRCQRTPGAIAKIATAVVTAEDRDTLLELLAQPPGAHDASSAWARPPTCASSSRRAARCWPTATWNADGARPDVRRRHARAPPRRVPAYAARHAAASPYARRSRRPAGAPADEAAAELGRAHRARRGRRTAGRPNSPWSRRRRRVVARRELRVDRSRRRRRSTAGTIARHRSPGRPSAPIPVTNSERSLNRRSAAAGVARVRCPQLGAVTWATPPPRRAQAGHRVGHACARLGAACPDPAIEPCAARTRDREHPDQEAARRHQEACRGRMRCLLAAAAAHERGARHQLAALPATACGSPAPDKERGGPSAALLMASLIGRARGP